MGENHIIDVPAGELKFSSEPPTIKITVAEYLEKNPWVAFLYAVLLAAGLILGSTLQGAWTPITGVFLMVAGLVLSTEVEVKMPKKPDN